MKSCEDWGKDVAAPHTTPSPPATYEQRKDLKPFFLACPMLCATKELCFPEKDLCGVPRESDEYDKWSPWHYIRNFKTPTLVITGELDYRVPYTQSLQYFTALQRREIPSRLVVFPGAGDWPSWYEMAFYYYAHLDWFHRYLGGGEAPWDVEGFARNQIFNEKDQEGGREE